MPVIVAYFHQNFFCGIVHCMVTMTLKKTIIREFFSSLQTAREKLSRLTKQQRSVIEKAWDIEHAYYSSALEGSKLDKKEFEKLGEKVA